MSPRAPARFPERACFCHADSPSGPPALLALLAVLWCCLAALWCVDGPQFPECAVFQRPGGPGPVAALWRFVGGPLAVLWRFCGGPVAVLWRSCGGPVPVLWGSLNTRDCKVQASLANT